MNKADYTVGRIMYGQLYEQQSLFHVYIACILKRYMSPPPPEVYTNGHNAPLAGQQNHCHGRKRQAEGLVK
jgi:hypothetical protein